MSASASAVPPAFTASVKGKTIECPNDRCRGKIGSDGSIRFDVIDPRTRTRWEAGPDQELVDRGATMTTQRYAVAAPSLDAVFATRAPSELLLQAKETEPAVVGLELVFPDGAIGRAKVSISAESLQFAFNERLKAVSAGPVALPGDAPHTGPPRAMWVEFPLVIRGTASTVAQIDWVLVFDGVPRNIQCTRRKNGKDERATFEVADVRGRVYERRTGKLVGEKTLPDAAQMPCKELFALRDEDIALAVSSRDPRTPTAIVDWAWGTLRGAP